MSDRLAHELIATPPEPIQPPDFLKSREEEPPVDFSSREYFSQYLGLIETHSSETSLYDEILREALDSGLRYEQSYIDPETREVHKAPAVGMLSRAGGTYLLQEYLKQNPEGSYQTFAIDISGVAQMDRVGAADYNLNMIADSINRVTKSDKYKNLPLIPMRYGGDEFVVLLTGNTSSEMQAQFQACIQEIRAEIQAITWNDATGPKQIGFTEELLGFPLEGIEQEITDAYVSCGTLLGRKDIDQILQDFSVDGVLDEESLRADLAKIKRKPIEYPSHVTTNRQKLEYFAERYRNLNLPIDVLLMFEGIDGSQDKIDFFADFIERIVYDPLLGHDVKKFNVLLNEISSGTEYREVAFIEGRFLKEFNKMSFLKGDIHRLNTWEVIKKSIPSEILEQLTIVSRGASFMIGIPEGLPEGLYTELEESLSKLTHVPTEIRGVKADLPIGVAMAHADHILPATVYEKGGEDEDLHSQAMAISFHKGIMQSIFTQAKEIVRQERDQGVRKKSYGDIVRGLISEYLFVDMRRVAENACDEYQATMLDGYTEEELETLLKEPKEAFDLAHGENPVPDHNLLQNYMFWLYYHEPKRLADRVGRTMQKVRKPEHKASFQAYFNSNKAAA